MNGLHSRKTSGLDLSELRAKLDGQTGPRFWRSLDELAQTAEFTHYLHREFPEAASEWTDEPSRRNFLRLMGASLALAGVGMSGCDSSPPEKILPYVHQPENLVPGKPLRYASAVSLRGAGTGVLVESHMGRPTMIEGNAKHPDSGGAVDFFTQASILNLYDPDRSKVVMRGKAISGFDTFLLGAITALEGQRSKQGAGVRILTETVTSPSLARQIKAFLAEFPAAKWHQYEPAAPHSAKAGARLAFGRDVTPRYDLGKADVILALDADFLACGPGNLRLAREFVARREPSGTGPKAMNRLYAVESTYTVTGGAADHRLPLRAHDVAPFAMTLARKLSVDGVASPAAIPAVAQAEKFLDTLADDLQKNKGASLVVAGETQDDYVHALAHAMNQALGNIGTTVTYLEPIEADPVDQLASIAELSKAMASGQVEVLFILGGNPAYNAPADLGFAKALRNVPFSVRLGLYEDESSALCAWHLPEAHELETWGDVRGSDGTATIQQPLIAPLYGGKSATEVIAALLKDPDRTPYEIVRATWREKTPSGQDFETFWRTAVHEGVVAGSRAAAVTVTARALGPPRARTAGDLEIVFRPDPTIFDGRFANNGWLQELPKPLTKLTWDNAALMSLGTAQRLGVTSGDVVELSSRGRAVEAPVWILPGHVDGSVTVTR